MANKAITPRLDQGLRRAAVELLKTDPDEAITFARKKLVKLNIRSSREIERLTDEEWKTTQLPLQLLEFLRADFEQYTHKNIRSSVCERTRVALEEAELSQASKELASLPRRWNKPREAFSSSSSTVDPSVDSNLSNSACSYDVPSSPRSIASSQACGLDSDGEAMQCARGRGSAGYFVATDEWSSQWAAICRENPWLEMQYQYESGWCPRCIDCDTWVMDDLGHLKSKRCRQKHAVVGPLLKAKLDNYATYECHIPIVMNTPPRSTQSEMLHEPKSEICESHAFDGFTSCEGRCANPYCDFLVHTDPLFVAGYCCKTCKDYHTLGYKKKVAHGKKCQQRSHSSSGIVTMSSPHSSGQCLAEQSVARPSLPAGSWYVLLESIEIWEGVDVNSAFANKNALKFGRVCMQAADPVVINDSESGQQYLRMPLRDGGWVTLATLNTASGKTQSYFQNPRFAIDYLEQLFGQVENFDALLLEAEKALRHFDEIQYTLRDGQGNRQELVLQRNIARLHALSHIRRICNTNLATQCRHTQWQGGGDRENAIDIMYDRLSQLEYGGQLNIDEQVVLLEQLKRHMKQTRLDAKRADLEAEAAKLEIEKKVVGHTVEETFEQDAKWKEARKAAKDHRKKLYDLRRLADIHMPEELHRFIELEQDCLRCEFDKIPSRLLQSKVVGFFDNERDLAYYDNRLINMRQIARDTRHKVYATSIDGNPCVLKRIDLTTQGLACFVKEIKYIVKLTHPLVVPIQCAFIDDHGCGYLQFEQYESDLMQWLTKQESKLEDRMKACRVINTIVQAVGWLHSQNVVHGDLKPANWLWDSRKSLPRLHDFETASEIHEEGLPSAVITATTPALRTWKYAAPELRSNPNLEKTKETDMFALGICIEDVVRSLLRTRSPEAQHSGDLISQLTCNDPCCRLTAEQTEERCRDLLNRTGNEEIVVLKCTDIYYSQNACSGKFTDGRLFQDLINAIVADPTYPLQHDSLVIDVVKMVDHCSRRSPTTWLHSVDNRRLYCFRRARDRLNEEVYVRVRMHSFGPTFDRFMGHYSTTNNGRTIRVRAYRP